MRSIQFVIYTRLAEKNEQDNLLLCKIFQAYFFVSVENAALLSRKTVKENKWIREHTICKMV